MHSWQVHLQRIAPYLSRGEGAWWTQTNDAYCFLDGEQHADTHPEGPHQLHYRSTSRKQLDAMKKEKWNAILASGTTLPTEYIQHYNEDGMPTCKTYFTLTTTATTPEDNLSTVLCLSPPATTSTPVQSCGYIYGTDDSDDDTDETSSSGYLDFASTGK